MTTREAARRAARLDRADARHFYAFAVRVDERASRLRLRGAKLRRYQETALVVYRAARRHREETKKMSITATELRTIQQAVADAFDDDASGRLELTASGIEVRPMADGSGRWAVFANGVGADGREVYRRRLVSSDIVTVDDVGRW